MTNHLDRSTIYALLDGELDPVAERVAETHLLRCEGCRVAREECRATLGALRAWGQGPPGPPADYWDGFWIRFEERIDRIRSRDRESSSAVRPLRRAWLGPAIAAAAAIALLLGGWWASGPDPVREPALPSRTVAARTVVADTGWESDVEFFERATVAVGGVDPLSKGIVLATLAESQ